MATSAISLCNQALNRLGLGTISSLDDGDDKSATCSLHYTTTIKALLTMNPDWRFCMQKRALSRLVTTPANVWQYEYQLPSNMEAGPHRVYNTSGVGARPVQEGWEIYGQTLATDFATVIIDYSISVAPDRFPVWFDMLCVLALTSALAKQLTDQDDLATFYHQAAFGVPSDNLRGGYFAVACQINRGGAGQQALQNNLFTSAMQGGSL